MIYLFTKCDYYKTIVADPPWQYRNKRTGGSMKSGAATKYPIMSLEEIKQLPVQKIAHKNSVLFLWVTCPMQYEGMEVMKAWGYRYVTKIYWRKIMSLGMGFWFRGQVEECWLGIRGKVKAFRCQHENFLQSKVRRHSQKPGEFFELIEPIIEYPAIELFAREKRNGWDAWGNEI
jgi:N6-adenosine-specific RNA methylase IME4